MRYASITNRLADTGGAKWAVHVQGRALAAEGRPMIELTIGEPDQPPDPALIEICAEAMRSGRTRYSEGRGEDGLLTAIAARYDRRRPGITPQNVVAVPGTQTALFAALLTLTEAGDEVLVGDPYYATYDGVIAASGARRVSVPLSAERGYRLSAQDLEAAVTSASRVVVLNTPHNPTGAVLTPRDIAEIGEVAQAHDLWIVSDEVYAELIYDRPSAPAFVSPFDDPAIAERVVVASSISKSHAAPGFRSGWLVGPEEFCKRLLPIAEAMLFGNQPFIADMTTAALSSPSAVAKEMREAYGRRAELVAELLGASRVLKPHPPQAGMFIMIDISATGLDGEAFAWGLLDHGVSAMPGASFGDSARSLIRLSLTAPDQQLTEACERILAYTHALTS
ncbi:MAG: pyridoxal phosphate-dependent aminotransferase [Rhodobacteraceae bacterium]|nr:pyridoxal phosphate-dependent aminotransferase [Paracoccaceae bacterium]